MGTSVPVELKPIVRIRVRCKEDHKDPWLRRLYVVWAPLPPSADAALFSVAQSDSQGYLSPPLNDLDPTPDKSIPLVVDVDYQFYFVRYPDASFANSLAKELNAGPDAKKKWGEPRVLRAVLTQTGVDKKKKPILEGVISLDEDPAWFLPQGSPQYGNWLLFRDMPGTGSNKKDADIQCRPLFAQVRRLQFHLGRLRYPVGNQWHPYSPEPAMDAKGRTKNQLYPNEGVFDVCLWNAVLLFQRNARAGEAIKLDPAKPRVPTLAAGSLDPLPAAADAHVEIRDSLQYVSAIEASPGEAFAAIPDPQTAIVDTSTADAIKHWLTKGFRKPGKVLVSRAEWIPWISWMQEDAYSVIEQLAAELTRLHVDFTNGFQVNNGFRDTRMSVTVAGAGQAIYSIHKSGFAFDMAMEDYVAPRTDAPLYFEKDEAASGKRVKWIVYALAKADQIGTGPFDSHVEYKDSIRPWLYDPTSTEGGSTQPELVLPGKKFLNFTKVCDHFLLRRISAHETGWQGTNAVTYKLSDAAALGEFINGLKAHLSRSGYTPEAKAKIDGTEFPLADLKDLQKHLAAWRQATATHNPTPTVRVEPWTKEGAKVVQAMRSKALAGRKVKLIVEGYWSGGKGAEGFPEPLPPPPPPKEGETPPEPPAGPVEGTITLSAKAEFPPKFAFVMSPITAPKQITASSVIELGALVGHPAHMEWWHFQYEPGYNGKKWGDILELIGWTREGLLGQEGNPGYHGLYGLGYMPDGLDKNAT
jgi:hypothetical protein